MNLQELVAEIFEHIQGMWRYRWYAVGIAWLLSVVGWIYVSTVPDVYRASTRVYVDTDSLLRPMMEGLTASQNTLNEVQLVSKAVLTRPNLEQVALDTDLALRANGPEEMEALVTDLQTRVRVIGGRDNIFSIQFDDVSREKARDVVAAVLDTFVESALGNDGDDADVTERAVAGEIQVHEQRLREAEAGLAQFKQANLGYMPDQYGDYYNRLQAATTAVNLTREKLRLVAERREELRRQIEGEEPIFGIMPMSSLGGVGGCSQAAHIQELEAQLSALLVQFTDKHPRALTLQETIGYVREQCAEENAEASEDGAVAVQPGQTLEANPVYQSLRIQLSTAEVELAEARSQLASEEGQVTSLRRNVDKITQVEAELKQLNRDYEVVQSRHQQLLKRWEDLQAKKRLDPVTDNVQFRRIEPPFALAEPIAPNRALLLAAVLVFAFGGGGVVAFGLNRLHPTFFARNSLRRVTDLPVLGSISMVLTPAAAAQRRRGKLAWVTACTMLVVCTLLAMAFSSQSSMLLRTLTGGIGA